MCAIWVAEQMHGAEAPIDAGRHLIVAVTGRSLDENGRALLSDLQPGGVVLLGENIKNKEQTRKLVRDIKKAVSGHIGVADLPLIYIDQEGGRINRLLLDDAPSATALGREGDVRRTHRVAALYGREAVARGIGVVLAPVLDLYQTGKNGVIGDRAFGENPEVVWRMGKAFAEGIVEGGALPVAKHFPGHGGTVEDSHTRLAHLNLSGDPLEKVLAPFRQAVADDIPAVMVGHIACGALDPEHPELPATLSEAMVNGLLRDTWGYRGVVITDDLNMKAIQSDTASAAVTALRAGCDAIMVCNSDGGQLRRIRDTIAAEARTDPSLRDKLATSLERLEHFRQRLAEISVQTAVPCEATQPSHQPAPTTGRHVVQHGETLSKIATQYGVSVKEIQELNGLHGDAIRTGQILRISE